MRNRQFFSISVTLCLLLAGTTFAAAPAAQDAAGRDDAAASADPGKGADETGIKQSILYATLTARVKSELLVNQNTDGLAINVDSHNGAVTLSGEVSTSTERVLAERIASNVNGTESVSNRLVVKPRKQTK
ncbi:MAG: BON domain-containing protein [Woeseiaceae bacterium]